jgi:two-component system C4-dicarboxylate transport response regulator DctD
MNRCGSALFMPQLFFGKSPATGELLSRAERFARTREPILLLGERGTGKTALGRYLHNLSGRSGPFVSVPVPLIAGTLQHSELLGHDLAIPGG